MQRRTKPLSPALAPLTPTIPEPTGPTVASLQIDLFTVRKLIRAERINNAKRENALAKYNTLLENVITSQRQAFEQLHAELVPNVLQKGKQ